MGITLADLVIAAIQIALQSSKSEKDNTVLVCTHSRISSTVKNYALTTVH